MTSGKKIFVQTKKLLPSEEINKNPVVRHWFQLNVLSKQASSEQHQTASTQPTSQHVQSR